MSDFSIPHGVHVTPPGAPKPSARVVADYAEYDRNYLLYRIEELEDSESALSEELAAMHSRAQRADRLLQAAADVYRHGADPIAEEVAAAVAAALPKRRRRKGGAPACNA